MPPLGERAKKLIMIHSLCYLVAFALTLMVPSLAVSAEPTSHEEKISRLRLFNTAIFGKSTADQIVLLKPAIPGQLDPETIMVDLDKGKYFAATVRYPNKVSFAEARRSLNTIYAKHEKKNFADDPTMGLWRNEDDKLAIQVTEDEDYLVVIYVKFSLLTKEKFIKSLGRAMRDLEKEDAQQ